MRTAEKTLEKMRNNPRDLRIEDVIAVARRYGMVFRNEGGSHYHFTCPDMTEHVSIPAHRPIKQVYIREFVRFIDEIREKIS